MASTCLAEKPPDTFDASAFHAVLTNNQREAKPSLVSWQAIHDHPEAYWTQVLVASVSADHAACSRLSHNEELTSAPQTVEDA
jgi:hypothetical protein